MASATGCRVAPGERSSGRGAPRAATGCQPERRPLSSDAVWRLRGRSNFTRLRSEGRRVRRGPISVTYVLTPAVDAPPRIGFAIGRHVGSAVVRNQLRRRLRDIVRHAPLPSGDYMISAAPAATNLTFSQLRATVGDALWLTTER